MVRLYMPPARKPGWRFTLRMQVIAHAQAKSWREWQADFPKILKKTKISRDPVDRFSWEAVRFEFRVCSFRFWKRELPENFSREDWTGQRFGKCSDFWSANAKIKGIVFWAALPGAQALTGFRSQRKRETWLVQTYKEYFIEEAQGKSWREWLADFPKIISQKYKYLAILSKDFGEKLSDWS